MRKIASGYDHADFILKHGIVAHLVERDAEVVDKRAQSLECTNYPHYVNRVALAIAGGEADGGILTCGTGVDVSIVTNKPAGIHAVVCSEPYSVQPPRQHNDTNVLASDSRAVGLEPAKTIVDAWLSTQYGGGRHQQCMEVIMAAEQQRN